jgi:hypothetical protein
VLSFAVRSQVPRLLRPGLVAPILLLAGLAGSASAKGVVPKGTPYAAEVKLVVEGDVHLADHHAMVENGICSGGANTPTFNDYASFGFAYKITYPQVTIPVAGRKELGKAYRRLHVRPTPTAKGKVNSWTAGDQFSGNGPSQADLCQSVNYDNPAGTLTGGQPSFAQVVQNRNGQKVDEWTLQVAPNLRADPPLWYQADGSEEDALNSFQLAQGYVPQDPTFDHSDPGVSPLEALYVALIDDPEAFRPLIHNPHHAMQTSGHYAGDTACEGEPDINDASGSSTCSVTWDYRDDVTIISHFLYRTKRAYRK